MKQRWFRAIGKVGIERDSTRKWLFHLRPRFFKILGLMVAVGLVGLIGMMKYSTSPGFCKSCHIMQPYYDAWKTSKHNFVACVDCHYPPGSPKELMWHKFQALSQVVKFVTRTYSSKPYAEIDDAACLRPGCHSTRLLEGKGKAVGPKGVIFDHRPHLSQARRGRQLRCASCHSQIVQGKHIEVTYDTCYLCHFKGREKGRTIEPLGGCTGCHGIPDKSFQIGGMTYNHKDYVKKHGVDCMSCHSEVVQGKGEAEKDRCFTCHNQPEKLAKYSDIPFIHDNHVTKHQVACFHCHKEIKHTSGKTVGASSGDISRPAMPGCSQCHQGQHGVQEQLYKGIGVKGLNGHGFPSPMYLANVDCVACHAVKSHVKGSGGYEETTFRGSQESCEKCHGPQYKDMWAEAKALFNGTLDALEAKLAGVTKAVKGHGAALTEVANDLEFIRAGRAVHNLYYAARLVARADETLNRLAEQSGVTAASLDDNPLVNGHFCGTLCHSKVGVKVPPDVVRFKGKTMPHRAHLDLGLSCYKCHDLGEHKKIKLKPDVAKKVCRTCHE